MKKDSDGLEVRQRILDIYSKTGFDGIDPGDLRGRMRWMGLYTQRAQGIPGGKTAVLEPEELEDSYFMMRARIDGGQLTSRSEEHTSELQSRQYLVCRLLLEKKTMLATMNNPANQHTSPPY